MALWIVEAKIKGEKRWTPVLGFPDIQGAHTTRKLAKAAAKAMHNENFNNKLTTIVLYRTTKYVPAP